MYEMIDHGTCDECGDDAEFGAFTDNGTFLCAECHAEWMATEADAFFDEPPTEHKTYKVNADFQLNVNTFIATEDLEIRDDESIEDAVKRHAIEQIMYGDYEPGDPIDKPTINWLEEDD